MTAARDFSDIFCVVGGKGHLDAATLAEMAGHLNATVRDHTTGTVHLVVDGYDDDEREVWQIPEVRDYLCRLINRLDIAVLQRLDEHTRAIVAVCFGLLRPIGRNAVNGNWQFEHSSKG
jgi:hypothetical protein